MHFHPQTLLLNILPMILTACTHIAANAYAGRRFSPRIRTHEGVARCPNPPCGHVIPIYIHTKSL